MSQAWATMLGRHCVPMVNKINEIGQGCSSTVPTHVSTLSQGNYLNMSQAWATMLGRHCVPMVDKINEIGQGCSSTVPTMDPHCPKVIT